VNRVAAHLLLLPLAAGALAAHLTYRVPTPFLGLALAALVIVGFVNQFLARPPAAGRTVRRLLSAIVLATLVSVTSGLIPGPALPVIVSVVAGTIAAVLIALLAVVGVAALAAALAPPALARPLLWVEGSLFAAVSLFALTGGLAFLNGHFDPSLPRDVATTVQAVHRAETDAFGTPWGYISVDLASWRRQGAVETVVLVGTEPGRTWPGQAVTVRVHPGALNVPWVSSVARDEEAYSRRLLEFAPTAKSPLRDLIAIYLAAHRWPETTAAALRYADLHPEDGDFLRGVAADLGMAGRNADALAILEPVARRHPTPEILGVTGYVLSQNGRAAEATAMLKEAIRLAPDEWLAYYRLAHVYRAAGRLEDALAMLEKALEREPGLPEVEQSVMQLRRTLGRPDPPRAVASYPPR
jgi:tetratricopeptide (TPR) repeat protein